MLFKEGDVVVVHKPKDLYEWPCWTSTMDKFDGKSGTIEYFTYPEGYAIIPELGHYKYAISWLTPSNIFDDEDFDKEDIKCLLQIAALC